MINDQHWPTAVDETVTQMADALAMRRHAAMENRRPNALPSSKGSAIGSAVADIYRRLHIVQKEQSRGERK